MPSSSTSTLEPNAPDPRDPSVKRFLTVDEAAELLDARALARRWSTSVRTIRRLIAGGGAPRPVRISARVIRWRLSEVRRLRGRAGEGWHEPGQDRLTRLRSRSSPGIPEFQL